MRNLKRTKRFTKILSFCGIRVAVLEKPIFVVEKRLAYEKISIFDKECDELKIK